MVILGLILLGLIGLIVYELKLRARARVSMSQYTAVLQKMDKTLEDLATKAETAEPLDVAQALASRPAPGEMPATSAVPVEAAVQEERRLVLGGVVWSEKQPLALINDTVLGLNEAVGNARVVEIHPERVVVEDGQGNRRTLELYQP
jgi:hypothetical protein